MVGRIAAGTPIEALQNKVGEVPVPVGMIGRGGNHYALEVTGDSMINAGILDGDTVIIQEADTATTGEIVVALVDNQEATLKRLRRGHGTPGVVEAAVPKRCQGIEPSAKSLFDAPCNERIVERRRAWSDCGGDVERAFTREHLLTTASLFWLTQTIGSSLRFYWETARQDWKPSHPRRPTIEAPTAMAVLPQDVFPLPRKVVEQHANLQHWRVYPKGGHFGPAEAPSIYVEDVRAFFRRFRRTL